MNKLCFDFLTKAKACAKQQKLIIRISYAPVIFNFLYFLKKKGVLRDFYKENRFSVKVFIREGIGLFFFSKVFIFSKKWCQLFLNNRNICFFYKKYKHKLLLLYKNKYMLTLDEAVFLKKKGTYLCICPF